LRKSGLFFFAFSFFGLFYQIAFAEDLEWIQVGTDFHQDISGIIILDKCDNHSEFLIAHDNKYPNETRLALLKVTKNKEVTYTPLLWPENTLKPVDIETISRHPDDNGYFLLTSKGVGVHFDLSEDRKNIIVLHIFSVPLPVKHRPNAEGFIVWKHEKSYYAAWADRGSNERAGIIFWGIFNEKDYSIELSGQKELTVPYPTFNELRHISEIRIDQNNDLFISSASEASNDGPFDGALYKAGSFIYSSGKAELILTNDIKPLYSCPGYKIEAFDMLAEPDKGLCLATDNENFGSFLHINWID